jgi:hypothetical protein
LLRSIIDTSDFDRHTSQGYKLIAEPALTICN